MVVPASAADWTALPAPPNTTAGEIVWVALVAVWAGLSNKRHAWIHVMAALVLAGTHLREGSPAEGVAGP